MTHTFTQSAVSQCPTELLSLICGHIYAAGHPPNNASLDPLPQSDGPVPTSLPASYPASCWSEGTARKTLSNLCLVNHHWYEAAKPWLWQKVEIRLPRSWLSLVEELAVGAEDETLNEEQSVQVITEAIQEVEEVTHNIISNGQDDADDLAKELHRRLMASLCGPDSSIPPELLSPPATRDPSPRRIRTKSKSPARWKVLRSINDAMQDIEQNHPGVYIPTPHDPHPGRFIRHLDFSHFRTIGMRRSLEEGVSGRFVTAERLLAVLKEMPNLLAFGATEYMDGALTYPVLQELFLRGSVLRGRGRPSRGRELAYFDNSPEEDDRERRRDYKELEALDLTGCVSSIFTKAFNDFVSTHLMGKSESDVQDADRQAHQCEHLVFPGLQRLGLRGMKSVPAQILHPFVLAFPSLTHLDLSCTRVTGELLDVLSTSRTVRLQSLALERCHWLNGESITRLLVDSQVTAGLKELSLYGDWTFPIPLDEHDMREIFTSAPCFKSGELVYLDISSAPVTNQMLLELCAPQPSLRSLGLSYIRNLELAAIAEFLKTKAPNVEILTLAATSPELGYGDQFISQRQATINLHAKIVRPLCTSPFSFSLSSPSKAKTQPPTRLRVIELAPQMLNSLGGGADAWRIVRSKGSRGWYVDAASGWIAKSDENGESKSVLRRDLEPGHPWRTEIERLADASGNVSSGIGWHARKMEILQGQGLLGREAGLYGAVSFAYQG